MKSFGSMWKWTTAFGLFAILLIHSAKAKPGENEQAVIDETNKLFDNLDKFVRPTEEHFSSKIFEHCIGYNIVTLKATPIKDLEPTFKRITDCAALTYVGHYNQPLNNTNETQRIQVYDFFSDHRNNLMDRKISAKNIPLYVTLMNLVRRFNDALGKWRVLLNETEYFFDKMNTFVEFDTFGRLSTTFWNCVKADNIFGEQPTAADKLDIINKCAKTTYSTKLHEALLAVLNEQVNQTDAQGNVFKDGEGKEIDTSKLQKLYDLWYDYYSNCKLLKVDPPFLAETAEEFFEKCREKNKNLLFPYFGEVYLAKFWNIGQF